MSVRTYDFALPHTIPGMYVSIGIGQLQSAGHWDELPGALRTKLQDGSGLFSSVVITKDDCDSIPDDLWKDIAAKLNLAWH